MLQIFFWNCYIIVFLTVSSASLFTATSILCPIFWVLWELLYAPIRMVLALSNLIAFVCTSIYEMLGEMWEFISSIIRLASASEATVSTYEVSMWRLLWNDLFSQVRRQLYTCLSLCMTRSHKWCY